MQIRPLGGELIGVEVDDELLTFECSVAVMDIVDGTYPPEVHDIAAYHMGSADDVARTARSGTQDMMSLK